MDNHARSVDNYAGAQEKRDAALAERLLRFNYGREERQFLAYVKRCLPPAVRDRVLKAMSE